MSTVGLRELRQEASELVRRVEAGEEITVTVAGRPSARLIAASPHRWRRWDAVSDRFRGPAAAEWGRGVEAGEEGTVPVAGRPGARLIAASPQRWRRWDAVSDLFRGPADTAWEADRERIDQAIRDPWAGR